MFTKGQTVTQIVPAPIVATVSGYAVDQETGALQVQVEWLDADGSTHVKFFNETEIE